MPTSKRKSVVLNEKGKQSQAQSKRRRPSSPNPRLTISAKRQKELGNGAGYPPESLSIGSTSNTSDVSQQAQQEQSNKSSLNNINSDNGYCEDERGVRGDDGESDRDSDVSDDIQTREEQGRRMINSPNVDGRGSDNENDDGSNGDNGEIDDDSNSAANNGGSVSDTQNTEEKRVKRGTYRPRVVRGWNVYFQHRDPIIGKDGLILFRDGHKETKDAIYNRWRKLFNLWDPSRESTKSHTSEISDGIANTDRSTDEDGIIRGSYAVAVRKQLEKELNEKVWNDWAVDPPIAEYPYLHNAFPYELYNPPNDRVVGSSHGPLPEPLPLDWYMPQGPVINEDFFSMDKLNYSTKMMRMINVEPDAVRMDIYYHRGFELASRKVMDSIRLRNKNRHPDYAHQDNTQGNHIAGNNIDTPSLQTRELSTSSADNSHISSNSNNNQQSLHSSEASDNEETIDNSGSGANPITLEDYYKANKFLSTLFLPVKDKVDPEIPTSPGASRILQTMLAGLETKILGMGCQLQREELTKRVALVDMESTAKRIQRSRSRRRPATAHQRIPIARTFSSSSDINKSEFRASITPSILMPRISTSKGANPAYRTSKFVDMDHYITKASEDNSNGNNGNEILSESIASTPASSSTTFLRSLGPSNSSSPIAGTSTARERSMSVSSIGYSDDETSDKQSEFPRLRPNASNPLMIPRDLDPFKKARDYLETFDARSRGIIIEPQSVPDTVTDTILDPASVSSSDLDSGLSYDSDIDLDSDLGSDL